MFFLLFFISLEPKLNILKGYSTPKFKLSLIPMLFQTHKTVYVSGTQFKIFGMKTRRLVTVPLTAKQMALSRPRKVWKTATPQGYFYYTLIWTKTAYPCVVPVTEQRTQFASSGYSPKWCYADAEETNCWLKSLFLFYLCLKGILIAS